MSTDTERAAFEAFRDEWINSNGLPPSAWTAFRAGIDWQARAAIAQQPDPRTFCGCGDQFTAHDPGTCGACVAAITCAASIAEGAAIAQQPAPKADTRKLCTCDGAGRGPGRACVVKAGGRLGELWRCAEGHEGAAIAQQPAKPEDRMPAGCITQTSCLNHGCRGACLPEGAAIAQPAEPANPAARPMTPDRAAYFMRRFKKEEKLLGPNEQAACDFVLAMLEAATAQADAQPAEPGPTMADAVAAGDGTLHGAIDHWQERALKAEKALAAQADAQPVAPIEDPVTVPRGLLGAACAAIDRKHDAPKTLAELRRYTVGDLSAAAAPPARQPLDMEAINAGWEKRDREFVRSYHSFVAGVAFAERAHGIGREGE